MTSQNIKVLIVDDEPKSRHILQTMITEYCSDVEIVGLANSVENAHYQIDLKHPDLVLLDIEMPFQNGFNLLENAKNNNYEVVFVSAFDHYALESLKYHALDYLLKPIDLEELENAIVKVKAIKYAKISTLASNAERHNTSKNTSLENMLPLSTQNGKKYLSVDEILYCNADASCSWIYMSDGNKFYTSKNLGQLEKELQLFNCTSFFRIHHSYLVNLLKVKSFYMNKNLVELENGESIAIAQRRKKELRALLTSNS